MTPPSICLCMIVKDEEPVLRRCLESVRPFIDSYVICDTGSTDATIRIARETLQGLEGDVFEDEWVNFAVNRTKALKRAYKKADYLLIIDADEVLVCDPGFKLPPLDLPAYYFRVESGDIVYDKIQLVDASLPWEYKGVLHEYIACEIPLPLMEGRLEGIRTIRSADGARARDPLTYKKDALVLERALLDEPENARYRFYLAQSYRDCGDLNAAIRNYLRRFTLGGNYPEETWYSLYQVAVLKERRGDPFPEVLAAYLEAFNFFSERAEPLYRIGLAYSQKREYRLAYLFLRPALEIPYPAGNRLFVEKPVYDYLLPLETAVAAYYLGEDREALDLYETILSEPELPPAIRALAEENRAFSWDRMKARN
jgi:glycosyltransferase involved in cell wall biosynthesis